MAEAQTETRFYENVIILDPQTPEEDQKNLFKKNQQIIESFGGKVNHVDTWGSRHLTNPIGKLSRGIYFHSTFSAGPSCVAELERTMRINERVLRFMHSRLDERVPLSKHLDRYKESLAQAMQKLEEKDARNKARMRQGGDRPHRHDRDFESDGE